MKKIFLLLLSILVLSSCNLYELTGQELESEIERFPRIEVSPSEFKVSDFGPMQSQRVTLRIYNAKFNVLALTTLIVDTPNSAGTHSNHSGDFSEIIMDIELTGGATAGGVNANQIELRVNSADYNSENEYNPSELRTFIKLK